MSAFFWLSFAALWVVVVVQGLAFLEVLRQLGQIRQQIGPQPGVLMVPGIVKDGDPLPHLSGVRADTLSPASWDDYLGPELNLIVLLTAHCVTCRHVAEDLTGTAADLGNDANVVAIVEAQRGELEQAQTFIRQTRLDLRAVVIDEGGETARRLGVSWNPAAVTARGRKLATAAIVNDAAQLSGLVYAEEAHNVGVR